MIKNVKAISMTLITILMLLLTGCASNSAIVHGLNEQEANEILVLLAKDNIPAYKIAQAAGGPGGGANKAVLWDIEVNGADRMDAMALLSANGLPRKHSPNLLELFSQNGLVPSDTAQKIRYEAGLATTLANTIRRIDGVIDADVIISFPEENPLNPNAPTLPIKATVFVKHNGILDNPNSYLTYQIKRLVSSAVSGLSYDNVTLITDRAQFSLPSTTQPQEPSIQVWDLTLALSTLKAFQITFFILFLIMCVLLFGIVWLVWKIQPIAKKAGGMLVLFSLQPIKEEVEIPEEVQPEEQKPPEETEKTHVQENIEE
ncbi:MAG: type III secretion inner membrane ring lipoprotein SctJ [Verrucomicrobia bacterium]|nr:type III secretion inner membrane ring lipoprotein SctJ [Verrucomicrobiota bacterium]